MQSQGIPRYARDDTLFTPRDSEGPFATPSP